MSLLGKDRLNLIENHQTRWQRPRPLMLSEQLGSGDSLDNEKDTTKREEPTWTATPTRALCRNRWRSSLKTYYDQYECGDMTEVWAKMVTYARQSAQWLHTTTQLKGYHTTYSSTNVSA